jgi:hypothetical protein
MPHPKPQTISNWKRYGLIHNDYNALYDEYINTTHCNHCQKEFKDSHDRCMDHDHNTGLFRKIVCQKCNAMDSYIKYPNGYDKSKYDKQYRKDNIEQIKQKEKQYYQDNKEYKLQKRKQKITCLCGSVIRNSDKARHLKTKTHLNNMDLYMENID